MGHEQLPVIGRLALFFQQKQERKREEAEKQGMVRGQVVLSEMAGMVEMGLDRNTQVKLEELIEVRPTDNVGFMAIYTIWNRQEKYHYPVSQEQMGDRTGGRGYRGRIIEGVRVRFLGPTQEQIEKISYGKFVRRIPTVCDSFASSFDAYQVVAEDEKATVYNLDRDGLCARQYRESDVLFSDRTHLPYDRMISNFGEKSMPRGYYGFMLSGYSIRPGSENLALDRENLKGILDLVTAHQQETADLLRQDGVRNLLDKIRFFHQSIENQKV